MRTELNGEASGCEMGAECGRTNARDFTLRVLKNKLSEYVRLAESGETVLVTDRDRVVAELRPPDATRSLDVSDALLADAMRRGVVRRPMRPDTGAPPRRPVATLASVLQGLAADRDDR